MQKAWTMRPAGVLALVLAGMTPAVALAQDAKPAKAEQPEAKPLMVGDAAPRIKVEKFVKGKEVKEFEKGRVYVVEFWATWCPPCKKSIPHLTEVAKKYKDKVDVIGVSVWENNDPAEGKDAYLNRVTEFANKGPLSGKMEYSVAYDGDSGEMANTWMKAARRGGIPSAFIVDQTGKLAWIGHPMSGMDEVLDKVVAGTFDSKAEAEKAAKAAEAQNKSRKVERRFAEAMQSGNTAEAASAAYELLEADSARYTRAASGVFAQMLEKGEMDAAHAFAVKVAEGAGKGNSALLNELAWSLVDPQADVKNVDLGAALKVAKAAVAASGEKDGMIMDTLARVYFRQGDVAKALELQEKAVALAKANPDTPDGAADDLVKTLDEYKAAKK